jgi:ABC-type branched-subunit amino acid transport system ATPase component/branched-subunit amino acid ABC-type transport system permease component
MLPFIIAGLVTGAVYGLAAVGLVLTYKTSGIFNFGYGALAAIGAYVFYELYVQSGWSWPLGAAVAVLVVGPALGLLMERLAKALDGASLAMRVAATVGLLIAIQAVIVLHYGQLETRMVPSFLPSGQFTVAGATVTYAQLITVVFALVSTVVLYAFFRLTRLGMAMRAVVDNADLLNLAGTSAVKVRRYAWIIGSMFATASGVLFAPLLPLDPTQLTLLIVPAFGAAAIGAFTSLPITFAGGLVIGVLASLSTKWFTSGLLAGLPNAVPFLVLGAVLIAFPRRWLVERAPVIPRGRATWTTPMPLQLAGGAALLIFLIFVPSFAGIHQNSWTQTLATVILFLSLGLLVRTSGQVSLGHIAFVAIGAAAFAHFSSGGHLPWLLALLCAGLIAVPVGAVLAIPAIRLSGLYLALATFGFAVFVDYMFYTSSIMFGSTGAGITATRPHLAWITLDSDKGYYYVVLAFAVAFSAFVIALNRSRLGRLLRGMADSPTALATSGVAVNVTRVLVFCISAFMAAIAGGLIAATQQTVSIESFPPLLSLTLLALIMIVIGGAPWYAIAAAVGLTLAPSYITGVTVNQWLQLLFGASAIAMALTPASRRETPEALRRALDRAFRRRRSEAGAPLPVAAGRAVHKRVAPGGLAVQGLSVRFGGLVAVDGVSFKAPTGRITGLIGPNGAGKTTTFNACSGLVRPNQGRVIIDVRDVTQTGPSARARLGLGRTFQTPQLFDSLPVWDSVAIGVEGALAGSNPVTQVLASRSHNLTVTSATTEALDLCGLTSVARAPAANLSTGQRRLAELARCLAGSFRILLLDEPTAGLDHAETAQFGTILKAIVAERGEGMLVVEHDMSFVMDVCDYIYVLDFGRLIFEGTPQEVRSSPTVRAAYLGDEAAEEAPLVVAYTPGEEFLS